MGVVVSVVLEWPRSEKSGQHISPKLKTGVPIRTPVRNQ